MKTKFIMMEMPSNIKVAVPIDAEEMIDSRLLIILRDQAWQIFNSDDFKNVENQ
jgi:hypothetical protein